MQRTTTNKPSFNIYYENLFLVTWPYPAVAFRGCLGRGGGGVPTVCNYKTIHGVEMKFGRILDNQKLIDLVFFIW